MKSRTQRIIRRQLGKAAPDEVEQLVCEILPVVRLAAPASVEALHERVLLALAVHDSPPFGRSVPSNVGDPAAGGPRPSQTR